MKEKKPVFHYGPGDGIIGEDPGEGIAMVDVPHEHDEQTKKWLEELHDAVDKGKKAVKVFNTPTGRRFLIGVGLGAGVVTAIAEVHHLRKKWREKHPEEKDQA